ncbi:hypothetical protein CHE218_08770 [Microbacterium sp. che218]
MPAHAERAVDEDGSGLLQGGTEQFGAALEENGSVDVADVHDVGVRSFGSDPHPLDLAPGKCVRACGWASQPEGQNSPGITSCSISAYVSSLLSA